MTARVWTLRVNAPCVWLTANDRRHRMSQAQLVKKWRTRAFIEAQIAKLPTGLARIRIDAVAHFRGRAPVRDVDNLRPTLKAVVDGLGPERVSHRQGRPQVSVGYGLIPDDNDAHLDGPYLTIGAKLAGGNVHYSSPGELVLTITEIIDDSVEA